MAKKIDSEFTAEQLEAVDLTGYEYEIAERLAILGLNNPDMHPVHAKNKATKEIRIRILRDKNNG